MRIDIKGFWHSFPIVLYMAVCMLPVISRSIGTVPFSLIIIFLFIAEIRKRIVIPDKNIIILFLLYTLYIIVEFLRVKDTTSVGNLYENILFLIPLLFFTIYDIENKCKKIVIVSFFAIQTYVAISNIILLINSPYLSKYLTGSVGYVVNSYQNSNLGSISNVFLSTIASILTVILFNRIRRKSVRLLLLALLIINAVYVVLARSFLCVLTLIFGILLFISKNRKYRIIVLVVTILFSLLLVFAFAGGIREYIYESNITPEYKNRLIDILDWINGTNQINNLGFISGRASDYLTSIITFLKHPLFGVGMIYSADVSVVGMHSEILDFLARYGLFAVLLVVPMLYKFYRIKETGKFSDSKHLLFVILLYLALNPCITRTSGIAFFWIIPMITGIFIQEKNNNDINYIK